MIKNSLISLITLFLFVFSAKAQETNNETLSSKSSRLADKLSLTTQVGLLHSWGDFREDEILPGFADFSQNKLGMGLLLNYKISRVVSVSGGLLYGNLRGEGIDIKTAGARPNSLKDFGTGIYFKTHILELYLPRVDINLTRLIFKDRVNLFNKWSLNMFMSHGIVNFSSKLFSINGDKRMYFSRERGRSNTTNEGVTSLGMSVSYSLNNRFDLNIESSIRGVWNDKLDAWVSDGSANDMYSYTAGSVSYHLAKRDYVVKGPDKPNLIESNHSDELEDNSNEVAELDDEVVEDRNEKEVDTIQENNSEDKIDTEQKKENEPSKSEPSNVIDNNSKDDKEKSIRSIPLNTEVYNGKGYFLSVGAFRGLESSKRMMKELISKGEVPVLIRNRINSWYLITIGSFSSLDDAVKEMKKARKNGYPTSWIHVKK